MRHPANDAWRVTAHDKIRPLMADPLLLYSTTTWLAYVIAERYYSGEHYVWCAPVYDPRKQSSVDMVLPPTSSPCEIYRGLYEETKRGDRHSTKIAENRVGILRGAAIKKNCGTITADQEREITAIVDMAEINDFRPLLYVIPFHQVSSIVQTVPVDRRAHPMSSEFLIERLPREYFDVLEINIGI
jgi:hypothetical protein